MGFGGYSWAAGSGDASLYELEAASLWTRRKYSNKIAACVGVVGINALKLHVV